MAHQRTESKRLLSHVIAEWACALKYEHLSSEAIQAAKLFWFDSIGSVAIRLSMPPFRALDVQIDCL
jgi:2-methylcitrate dehydratase PrpD